MSNPLFQFQHTRTVTWKQRLFVYLYVCGITVTLAERCHDSKMSLESRKPSHSERLLCEGKNGMGFDAV